MQGGSFWRVQRFPSIFQKIGFVFIGQICHYKALNQYSVAQMIPFRLLVDFKTNLQENSIYCESFRRVLRFASLSKKNTFVFVNQIQHNEGLNQFSMTQRIQFRLLTDFKANSQEWPKKRGSFCGASRLALPSQKKCFELVFQIWHFKALDQYSIYSEEQIQGFDRLEKRFIENFNTWQSLLRSSKVCLAFPEIWLCIC